MKRALQPERTLKMRRTARAYIRTGYMYAKARDAGVRSRIRGWGLGDGHLTSSCTQEKH